MKTKRILAAVAAFIIAGTALPVESSVFAEEPAADSVSAESPSEETTEALAEGVVFTAESYGDYIKITGFTGSADIAVIPAEVAGIPVTSIGKLTPDGSIGKLVIPASVTNIENGAFDEVTNLFDIEINTENTVFSSADGVLYNKEMTELLVYPYAKTSSTFTIPDSVSVIADDAFKGCIHLKEIVFGNGIKEISSSTLKSCYHLTSISIPASVESIADDAFTSFKNLESISVAEENTAFCTVDGVLYNKDMTQLIKYPPCKKGAAYLVPDGVSAVSDKAFAGTELVAITLPATLETIGNGAFTNMKSLATAVFEGGVQEISENAFAGDSSLITVVINSASAVKSGAFKNCSSIQSISLPANTAEIDLSAFEGCSALENINISPANENYSSINGVLFDKSEETLIKYTLGRDDKAYTIPDSVITVADKAFEDCTALESITLGASFAVFEGSPFAGCTSLADYVVSDENAVYSSIEGVLFNKEGTVLLKYPIGRADGEYNVPDSLASFDAEAFADNFAITAFVTSDTCKNFSSADGVLLSKDGKTIIKYPSASEADFYEIPEGIETINAAAFDKAEKLEGISFSNSNTAIVPDAFVNTSSVFVMYGIYGSTADVYANLNGFEFIAIDGTYAFGDVNDDGTVDAIDASSVLSVYALTSTGHRNKYIDAQKLAADIDGDEIINAIDASRILAYYAYAATTQEEILSIADYYSIDDPTVESPAEPETEAPTEAETEAPTEAETEAPTEAETEAPTEAETEVPTEAETEAPTEAETEVPTEADEGTTEATTEVPTEESQCIAVETLG